MLQLNVTMFQSRRTFIEEPARWRHGDVRPRALIGHTRCREPEPETKITREVKGILRLGRRDCVSRHMVVGVMFSMKTMSSQYSTISRAFCVHSSSCRPFQHAA
jgi:hypothetical protein